MKKIMMVFALILLGTVIVACDDQGEEETIKYTVIFDVNAGDDSVENEPDIIRVDSGKYATEPTPDPIRDGYDFLGWFDNANADGDTFDFDNTAISSNNFVLYAGWSETVTYLQVTFNFDNDESALIVDVAEGETVDAPNEPEKDGYRFDGWYLNETLTSLYNFETSIDSSFNLYAKWVQIITLTFNYNYEGAPSSDTVIYDLDETVAQPTAPTRTGYIFGGWYTDSETTTSYEFDKAVEDLVLYAKWIDETSQTHTVTFNYNYENSPENVDQEVVDGGQAVAINTERTGYRFDGWYTDQTTLSNRFALSTEVSEDVTLYAKWVKTYVVTIYYNYDGATNPQPLVVDANQQIELDNPFRLNYDFAGWSDETTGNLNVDLTQGVSQDMNIYAQWTKNYAFEAEYLDYSDFFGWGFSGNATGTDAILSDTTGQGEASNGHYVSYLYGEGITLSYEIYSDREVTDVTLVLRLSGEVKNFYIQSLATPGATEDEPIYTVKVNEDVIDYGNISFFGVPSQSENTLLPFADFVLSINITLHEGLNTINLITDNTVAMGGTMNATAPMIDNLQLETYAILTWNPILDNY